MMTPELQLFAYWSAVVLAGGLVVGWWVGRRSVKAPDMAALETRYTEEEVRAERDAAHQEGYAMGYADAERKEKARRSRIGTKAWETRKANAGVSMEAAP